MTDLSQLLEKVRMAEAGSALLDAELYATVGGAPHTTKAGERTIPLVMKGDPTEWPDYTRSLDAASELIERQLLVNTTRTVTDPSGCSAQITWWPDGLSGGRRVQSDEASAYLPLAMVSALLSAMLSAAQVKP